MTAGDITIKFHANFRKRSIKNSKWKNPVAIAMNKALEKLCNDIFVI